MCSQCGCANEAHSYSHTQAALWCGQCGKWCDPASIPCEGCGAESGEECMPGCTGQAEAGWGSLPANFRPEKASARKAREDQEYRLARHAELLREERETLGYATERAAWREGNPPLTYRAILQERSHASAGAA